MNLNQIRAVVVGMFLLIAGTNICAQQSEARWVPYTGSIPANAVVGGSENGQPMYVGRVSFEGGTHPGKIISGGFCNIGWGGKEYSFNEGFEILTAPANSVTWVEYKGSVLANAVLGGYNDPNRVEPLYIAKHAYKGGEHCGKLWANACNIGWGGAEIVLNQKIYILAAVESAKTNVGLGKVTSQSQAQWIPYAGSIPANAVVGGSENGQPMYVGRVLFQGGMHPGKVLPGGGGLCNIGWGGKEYSFNQGFEILTAPANSVSWVEYKGSVPANAVLGGYNDAMKREPLYVAKHAYKGGEHCGKLWANACNIGWGGAEVVLTEKIYILVAQAATGATQPAVINTAKTTGATVRTTSKSYFVGQTITVEYSGFPGTSSAWITIVTKGKADSEWGESQYAREKSGKLEYDIPFISPGEYEVRGYFDSFDYKVQARYSFKIESGGN
ncbi:DUF3421 domain-containing protein [bacterium]|nr:DUF3421 domain-containing protein [bacterium]